MMRLRQLPVQAFFLLLPVLQILIIPIAAESSDQILVRARSSTLQDNSPMAKSPFVSALNLKGTKDAPVDGVDGKPHAGPYVDDTPESLKKSNTVEELRPGKKPANPSKPPTILVGQDDGGMLDGDKSVMQDPDRKKATGSTGTEGGVSAKDKERLAHEFMTGEKIENIPEPPKEAHHHLSGGQKQLGSGQRESSMLRAPGAAGLEKPTNLPSTPHDLPHPVPTSMSEKNHLPASPGTKTSTSSTIEDGVGGGVIQPFHSFILSFTMIIFSEIGDKTFLIAALMAMRHPRLVVFSAAFSALFVMTVLSAVLGHAVPTLLSERLTHFAAACLFLIFGVKLMKEGMAMRPDEGVGEEMREVEQELEEKEQLARHHNGQRRPSISPYALESGRTRRSRSSSRLPAPARSPSSSPDRAPSPRPSSLISVIGGLNNLFSLLLSPAWVQTFIMTFLGEWGDRSQIATVAMAAGSDYWFVTAGAVFGHGLCTAGAVIGGRAVAGRISMRNITLGGAIAFLVFGVVYLLEAYYHQ